jgi:MqsR (Motility quorum-sensing regulator) toxin of toxin-antitoxin system
VYHADTECGVVYLKLTAVEDLLIISFKEKDE